MVLQRYLLVTKSESSNMKKKNLKKIGLALLAKINNFECLGIAFLFKAIEVYLLSM